MHPVERAVDLAKLLADAGVEAVSLLDDAGIDGIGQRLCHLARAGSRRRSARQGVGEQDLADAEAEPLGARMQVIELPRERLQTLPLPPALPRQGIVLLAVHQPADDAGRQSHGERKGQQIEQGDDAEDGDLEAIEEKVADALPDIARMDLDLDSPACARRQAVLPHWPAAAVVVAAEGTGALSPLGFRRSISASLAWRLAISRSSRCTRGAPATMFPPAK